MLLSESAGGSTMCDDETNEKFDELLMKFINYCRLLQLEYEADDIDIVWAKLNDLDRARFLRLESLWSAVLGGAIVIGLSERGLTDRRNQIAAAIAKPFDAELDSLFPCSFRHLV